jgi:hypothetical protein
MQVAKWMLPLAVAFGSIVGIREAGADPTDIPPGACKPVTIIAAPRACTPVVQLPPVKACDPVKVYEPVKACEPVKVYEPVKACGPVATCEPVHPLHKLKEVKHHIEAKVHAAIERLHTHYYYADECGCSRGVSSPVPTVTSPAPAPANLPVPPTPNKG